jgi:hypothetical protein
MTKKEEIQEHNFDELMNTKINPIHSRYVAFKLAEIECIINVIEQINDKVLKLLCSKGTYLVTLPNIPIPDAKIELM